jgi:hypothetical protein
MICLSIACRNFTRQDGSAYCKILGELIGHSPTESCMGLIKSEDLILQITAVIHHTPRDIKKQTLRINRTRQKKCKEQYQCVFQISHDFNLVTKIVELAYYPAKTFFDINLLFISFAHRPFVLVSIFRTIRRVCRKAHKEGRAWQFIVYLT